MNDENELLEPLATEAGQEAIVRAIRDISSLEYAVRAEQAASTASAKAGEASQSALEASEAEDKAKDWATKTDTYVEQETITIPPEQEGEEPTTETINLYSARYYAALAQDIYNNMSFDSVPTENSTNMVSSGTVYSALDLKADKSTTYTKTETDNLINTRLAELVASAPAALDTLQELATALGNDPNFATTIATQLGNKADKSDTYTKTEVDTALSNVQSTLTFDNVPTANSNNPVKSSGIKTALDGKQDNLTFDSTPTANSTNPVTSGGVYTALQNVDIDVDTSITQNSTNPVTSAAIYEALQNLPSGGGSGDVVAGSIQSGIIEDVLFESSTGISSGTINLSGNISNYDLIQFTFSKVREGYSSNDPNIITKVVSADEMMDIMTTKQSKYVVEGLSNCFIVFNSFLDNSISISYNHQGALSILKIVGIKFSKNLSEQMYSNVLYENSSGWSSGSITLSDSLDNYDFIEIQSRATTHTNDKKSINIALSKEFVVGEHFDVNEYDNRYIRFLVYSNTQLNFVQGESQCITKITGIKLAKGGYSGIVSDARMTVKSGSYTHNSSISSGQEAQINITFDSPMPDTNYYVSLCRTDTTAEYGTLTRYKATTKTINGFTLILYADGHNVGSGYSVDWIAIRPNSYTREGMVEDVLFSNASGVNSGTINLSGNISDYDLIQFTTDRHGDSNDKTTNTHTITSSQLQELTGTQQGQNMFLLHGFNEDYIKVGYVNDNTLQCGTIVQRLFILKIVGIKFGRYVSGVAVDTEVIEDSPNVVTSGAVYDALQNYTPSGGGSGSSITIDSVPTENSQNAVSSGGVYDALQNINITKLKTLSPSSTIEDDDLYYIAEANCKFVSYAGRDWFKVNNIPALCSYAIVQNILYPMLLSLDPDGVQQYCSYNTSDITRQCGTVYDSKNGKFWYYSYGKYIYGGYSSASYSYAPRVEGRYSSFEDAALQILEDANPTLSGSYIEEDLFNPKNITITSGSSTIDSTVISLISGFRPIKINGETYYFVKLDNGTYYYENPNNTITIDSSWVVTITAKSSGGSSITVDSTITQGGTNPVEGSAIYTALGDKADKSTTYTKTEVDTALASKGDVTTDTAQNITGTKTFVGSKKVAFKQSAANDKLGFTLFGNTGTERGYLEFNPTNTVDGVAGLMTLGNYATSAAGLTQVGFRRYSNISGASGAYNLLMPMVADARTPFSLTTSYTNFYLPLGFTDGTTTVKTAKSGLVDLSPLLASLEARIAALEGN